MKTKLILVALFGLFLHPTHATSLWQEADRNGRAISLFSDQTAANKGDLVTIIVNLSTTATKQRSSESSKEATVDDRLEALLGPFMGGVREEAELLRRQPQSKWSSSHSFKGDGTINNSETLTATIQARVTDVMPNKVLRLEASRRVETGDETSYVVLTGYVRQEDVSKSNTVQSTQVADLQVKEVGNGAISREQRKGWLTRFWETISPF